MFILPVNLNIQIPGATISAAVCNRSSLEEYSFNQAQCSNGAFQNMASRLGMGSGIQEFRV